MLFQETESLILAVWYYLRNVANNRMLQIRQLVPCKKTQMDSLNLISREQSLPVCFFPHSHKNLPAKSQFLGIAVILWKGSLKSLTDTSFKAVQLSLYSLGKLSWHALLEYKSFVVLCDAFFFLFWEATLEYFKGKKYVSMLQLVSQLRLLQLSYDP